MCAAIWYGSAFRDVEFIDPGVVGNHLGVRRDQREAGKSPRHGKVRANQTRAKDGEPRLPYGVERTFWSRVTSRGCCCTLRFLFVVALSVPFLFLSLLLSLPFLLSLSFPLFSSLSLSFPLFLSRVTRAGLIEDVGGADLALTERERKREKERKRKKEKERERKRKKETQGETLSGWLSLTIDSETSWRNR